MRYAFKNKKLKALYVEEKGANKYESSVVDAFFDVMTVIEAMPDERELYTLKSLRFEKLQGKRGKRGERSLRLNNQWRLIVTLEEDNEGTYLQIVDIEDYH